MSDERQAGTIEFTDEQLLTAEDLFAGGKVFTPFEVPEMPTKSGRPGVLFLRGLSAGTVLKFMSDISAAGEDQGKQGDALAPLIVEGIVKRDGTPMFTIADIEKIKKLDMRVYKRLSGAITEMMRGKDETPASATVLTLVPTPPSPSMSGSDSPSA